MQIKISPKIVLTNLDVSFRVTRASGPGGQHVNKTDSAVHLLFNIHSNALSDNMRTRLRDIAGKKISAQGILILKSDQFRSQYRNKQAALARLKHLLILASHKPKMRHTTQPSKTVLQKRQQQKQLQSKKKANRGRKVVREE